jgi:hypothetical protein
MTLWQRKLLNAVPTLAGACALALAMPARADHEQGDSTSHRNDPKQHEGHGNKRVSTFNEASTTMSSRPAPSVKNGTRDRNKAGNKKAPRPTRKPSPPIAGGTQ